ncbi:lamin tail domain-containing protein [Actinomadura madurae]|uniref:lamin tail domain-containing protein n=1 Tax=Actinomadura madurae TaxID=1993 RepID=UPI0020D24ABB|nr:lamin tail domain-containing protein [Actinomadura madurae]MCP9964010.1 lamin tail domain-containing protein [Actinomadura madurae]MCP9976486.1 lamin tail domain-containing protein [Actinomadura madurae]MCQ0012021.1 lamin tail domain-containing protein [Actinomadura madurae]
MKRIFATAAAAVTAVGVMAAPAEAASPVQIYRVYFDSPGSDNRSNKSLNGEWVQLFNTSKSAKQLKGVKLRDKTGYTYTFGSFKLGGRKSVYVHTGKGRNTATHRYWGRGSYVWNNGGDTAYLLYASGKRADSCSWTSKGSSKYC